MLSRRKPQSPLKVCHRGVYALLQSTKGSTEDSHIGARRSTDADSGAWHQNPFSRNHTNQSKHRDRSLYPCTGAVERL